MGTNCTVNLGPLNMKLMPLARLKYPHYVREQKIRETQSRRVHSNVPTVQWESQLRSGTLTRFLRAKDSEDYKKE